MTKASLYILLVTKQWIWWKHPADQGRALKTKDRRPFFLSWLQSPAQVPFSVYSHQVRFILRERSQQQPSLDQLADDWSFRCVSAPFTKRRAGGGMDLAGGLFPFFLSFVLGHPLILDLSRSLIGHRKLMSTRDRQIIDEGTVHWSKMEAEEEEDDGVYTYCRYVRRVGREEVDRLPKK